VAVSEKIVLVFAEVDASEVRSLLARVDVRQLLRDSLGEFIEARYPVKEYVQKRYRFEPGSTAHVDKIHEVSLRSRLARLLKRAEPEQRSVGAARACTLYKLVLIEEVQLDALSGRDSEEARRERRRLWGCVGYDVHIRFVIAARSEAAARVIACECERDTHRAPGTVGPLSDERSEDVARRWLDPTRSVCEVIGTAAGEDAEHERVVSS
jgi:hypothetical protein